MLETNPTTPSQLLIGYEFGGLVVYELGRRRVKQCCVSPPSEDGDGNEIPALRCAAWHPNGKQIAAGYEDGRLLIWRKGSRVCASFLYLETSHAHVLTLPLCHIRRGRTVWRIATHAVTCMQKPLFRGAVEWTL